MEAQESTLNPEIQGIWNRFLRYKENVPGLTWVLILAGISYGVFGVLLAYWGNPANTGICISCFLEGTVGALGLHGNERMMYIRPEIIGFILGAFALAVSTRNFSVRGGSSPVINFVMGFLMIAGSAVFMGCPIKLIYRFTAGDLTAMGGVAGLLAGIWVGITFMKEGTYMGDVTDQPKINGLIIPAFAGMLLLFIFLRPSYINFSGEGPGSAHAPMWISLGVGLFLGTLSQQSRFCIVGSLRNYMLARDRSLMTGLILLVIFATVTNMLLGLFHLGMYDQPGSHLDHIWSFGGMFLTGFSAVIVGGCPLRQLILAGEGNADSGITTLGMLTAAAMVHNWNIVSSTSGATFNGKITVMLGIALCFLIALVHKQVD
ncbi:MAG: YedE family putative selenium transporter [bacterium]